MKAMMWALRHPSRYNWLRLRPFKRHSLVLITAGAIFIMIGWSYILTAPTDSRVQALQIALNLCSLEGWGVAFIVAGSLGMLSARWPEFSEKWGYTAMAGMASWWANVYLWGVLLGADNSSISGGLVWILITLFLWAISGLENPHEQYFEKVEGEW